MFQIKSPILQNYRSCSPTESQNRAFYKKKSLFSKITPLFQERHLLLATSSSGLFSATASESSSFRFSSCHRIAFPLHQMTSSSAMLPLCQKLVKKASFLEIGNQKSSSSS
jgi:hypothetical protein